MHVHCQMNLATSFFCCILSSFFFSFILTFLKSRNYNCNNAGNLSNNCNNNHSQLLSARALTTAGPQSRSLYRKHRASKLPASTLQIAKQTTHIPLIPFDSLGLLGYMLKPWLFQIACGFKLVKMKWRELFNFD